MTLCGCTIGLSKACSVACASNLRKKDFGSKQHIQGYRLLLAEFMWRLAVLSGRFVPSRQWQHFARCTTKQACKSERHTGTQMGRFSFQREAGPARLTASSPLMWRKRPWSCRLHRIQLFQPTTVEQAEKRCTNIAGPGDPFNIFYHTALYTLPAVRRHEPTNAAGTKVFCGNALSSCKVGVLPQKRTYVPTLS